MRALVLFEGKSNYLKPHRLGWLLDRDFQHCAAVVQYRPEAPWFHVDTVDHRPHIRLIAMAEENPKQFYRDLGFCVLETRPRKPMVRLPFAYANCVGLTKAVLGIGRPWIVTPRQLYNYLRRHPR